MLSSRNAETGSLSPPTSPSAPDPSSLERPAELPVALTASPATSAARAVTQSLPLVDTLGRVHRSLRISVTDRCNIRCQYCMPEHATFLDSHRLLTFEEIDRFVRVVSTLGISKVRITGGEPLMRPELARLFRMLGQISGVDELALTTNGMLLPEQIDALVDAGLSHINISLDTLSEQVFKQLTRRDGVDRVLKGIDAAIRHASLRVKLNALVMRDINYDEAIELVRFAKERQLTIRFIEFMPLDADRAWSRDRMVSGQELRARLATHFGRLEPITSSDKSQPSIDYRFTDGSIVGFIDSVTGPFCATCDRLRLTADGKVRNCLFSQQEWDVKALLRSDASIAEIESSIRQCVLAKKPGHGIDAQGFEPPERAMYQIGG